MVFRDPFRKTIGGIKEIFFIPAAESVLFRYDPATACYTSAEFAEPDSVLCARFREDGAVYSEVAERYRVHHRLEFGVFSLSRENALLADQLRNRPEGWTVILAMNDGNRLLAGYSEIYGVGRPLRMTSCEFSSGTVGGNDCTCRFSMESFDSTPAAFFLGPLPYPKNEKDVESE